MNYELEHVITNTKIQSRMYHLYLDKTHYMKRHYHPYVEIVYVLKGSFYAYRDGQMEYVKAQQLLFIQPFDIHYFEMIEDSEMITVLIPYQLLKDFDPSLETKRFSLVEDHAIQERFIKLMKTIDKMRKSQAPLHDLALQRYFYELYFLLLKHMTQVTNQPCMPYATQIQPIMDYIEAHYQEHISYQELSQQFGYSYPYFCRHFKQMSGMSCLQFQKMIQLKHAYLDVCYSDLQINQIAYIHGFSNPKLFIQAFKKEYHQTPHQYRLEMVKKEP